MKFRELLADKKKKIIWCAIYCALMVLAFGFTYYQKSINEFYMSYKDKVIIVLSTGIGAVLLFFAGNLKWRFLALGEITCVFLTPLFLYVKLEPLVNGMESIKPGALLFNWVILLGIFLIVYGVCQNTGITTLVAGGLVYAFYIVDFFTIRLRGTPVLFSDILSVKTAAAVSGGYSYVLNDNIVIAFYELALLVSLGFFVTRKKKISLRLILGTASLAIGIVILAVLVNTNLVSKKGFQNSVFIPSEAAAENGLFLNCVVNVHNAKIEEPSGYSNKEVSNIIEKYSGEMEENQSEIVSPNIIVIMNESFTDVDYLKTVKTSEETIPFFESLRDKSVSGTLISSILGGNTPNSEFEFLTGCSMAFLPTGTVAYQQIIDRNLPTVASMLKDETYNTLAVHLYQPEYFDRQRIYPLLGLDRFINEDNYSRDELVVQYTRKDTGYSDDSSTFEIIRNEFEKKKSDDSLFCFCVTIQNHGGYWTGLNSVRLLNENNDYANEYLSLLKMSDDAFKEFITYFETIDEPTIVCMYGDHQPYLFADDYVSVWDGCDYSDEEKRYMQAKVPFVIWANYDIEYCDMGEMSINYLGPTLLKTAGMPMSDYFWFLDELRNELPVVSAVGFVDSEGNHFTDIEISKYADRIREYEYLQYNYLKGNVHRAFYD